MSLNARLVFGLALLAAEFAASNSQLTPLQKSILAKAQVQAKEASTHAETELLKIFNSPVFRLELIAQGHGSSELAKLPAVELVNKMKSALASLEYVFNFGLDPAALCAHPGQPAWSLELVDQFGHIPTMWELKATGSPLAKTVPEAQWKLVDAEETGLYRMPEFAHVADPSPAEAAERFTYASGNTLHIDVGIWRYGVYAPVFRQSVMKSRGILIGADGGGWETACNQSLPSINEWAKFIGRSGVLQCDAISAGGASPEQLHFGTVDNSLHTMLANSKTFHNLGGSLPRLVHRMLTPGSTARPLENNMFIEGAVFGPVRMQDVKLMVGNFPDLIGTPEADALRDFCRRHRLPLAWGFGGGQNRSIEESQRLHWIPYEPFEKWTVGNPRLFDPSSWNTTDGADPQDGAAPLWAQIHKEIKSARATSLRTGGSGPSRAEFQNWWQRLAARGTSVGALTGGECASVDLCFGTLVGEEHSSKCLCRLPPDAAPAVFV